jgi:hypothetical protein
LKLRQKLIQRLTPLYQNELIVQETFLSLVRDLAQLLPDSIVTDVITDSIRYVVGQRLSAKELDELCWRLAGNLPRLKQRRAVPPWNRQPFQELVPAQIVKVQLRRGGLQRGELGHEITFRILAGTSCPLKVHKWWSVRASRFMAYFRDANRHGFGFARSRGEEVSPYRYEDPRQFMSLRCLLLIDPELCDLKDGPGFQEIYHTSATMEWNREIRRQRARLEPGYECPHDMPPTLACHQCPVGRDRCRAATHAETYELDDCPQCGMENWFDPAIAGANSICIACLERNILYPKET